MEFTYPISINTLYMINLIHVGYNSFISSVYKPTTGIEEVYSDYIKLATFIPQDPDLREGSWLFYLNMICI